MLSIKDPEIHKLIKLEQRRQKETLSLIPSENYCSKEVLQALGSILNNKYAEGYPKKRYYQGNKVIDSIETLAIERAKALFNAEHANVQPNSGSPANMAVYFAMLKPGDTILTLDLSHGGHLTHGSKVNFSGKAYNVVHYTVDKETGLINMDEVREIAQRCKPELILSGFTAYPRLIDFNAFHDIAKQVGAYSMADISHIAGLIAGRAHPTPCPFTDFVTTTTHKTLRGPRGAIIFSRKEFAEKIDKAIFPGIQGGPHEHAIAAKAVCLKEAMRESFKRYAHQIVKNAKVLAKVLIKHKIKLVTDGTDNHLILIDLIKTEFIAKPGLGKLYATALEEAGIVTNCNTIPYDPSTPFKPSGIRLGTPAATTMGLKEKEMIIIGRMISAVLKAPDNITLKMKIRKDIRNILRRTYSNL